MSGDTFTDVGAYVGLLVHSYILISIFVVVFQNRKIQQYTSKNREGSDRTARMHSLV